MAPAPRRRAFRSKLRPTDPSLLPPWRPQYSGWLDDDGGRHRGVDGGGGAATTALSSREYLVDGTFTGVIKGGGSTKLAGGTLEAGYQIGCGIVGGPVELTGGVGLTPTLAIPGLGGTNQVGGTLVSGQIKIGLKPGTVNIVPVDKKSFKGADTRVTITGFRIKVDGCVGQSFIRSYATLTSSTENTDDVITYMGVTKAV